jgi:uncharacterized protein (TIGR02466 family)
MQEAKLNPLADIARNGRVEEMFTTPIFWHVLPDVADLNDQLKAMIIERERATPTATKSNVGGWQSAADFFSWPGQPVAALGRLIHCALDVATVKVTAPQCLRATFDLYGWAAINRKGHYNLVHLHPMATWSGVYYVDAGEPAEDTTDGALEFTHPVTASTMTFFPGVLPSARIVKPQTGMLILFPSYLLHSVRMYRAERPRICVPFNAHLRQPHGGPDGHEEAGSAG